MSKIMADIGKQLSIVTQFGAAAPLTDCILEGPNILHMLNEKNVTQYGGQWVEECAPGNVVKAKLFEGYRIVTVFGADNPQQPLPFPRERMIWGRDNLADRVS